MKDEWEVVSGENESCFREDVGEVDLSYEDLESPDGCGDCKDKDSWVLCCTHVHTLFIAFFFNTLR